MDLDKLSAEELRTLQAEVAFRLQYPTQEEEGDIALVYNVIKNALTKEGFAAPPLAVVLRGSLASKLRKGAKGLEAFVRKNMKPKTRNERIRAYALLIKILMRWMRNAKVAIYIKTVIFNLDKIPAIVSREFPGYVRSGLMHFVLRQAASILV